MAWLRRILVALFKVFAVLSLTVVLVTTTLFFFPGILIQDSTLPWLGRVLRAYEIPVQWEEGHWSARSLSFWEKEIRVQLLAPCFSSAQPYSRACFSSIDTAFAIDLKTKSLSISWLRIPKGNVRLEALSTEKAESSAAPSSPLKTVDSMRATWLPKIKWKDVSIQNTSLQWTSPTGSLRAQFSAVGTQSGEKRDLQAKAEGTYAQKGIRTPVLVSVGLHTNASPRLSYKISGYWGVKKDRYEARTSGVVDLTHIQGELIVDSVPYLKRLPYLTLHSCRYEWREDKPKQSHLRMDCPVTSGKKIRAQIHGDLKTGETENPSVTLESQIEIADFEEAVRRLEKTPWAIPAPLNRLKGKITASAQASTDWTFQKGTAEWIVNTDLNSTNQKLRLDSDGTLKWENAKQTRVRLDSQVVFSEATLSLPYFDLTRLPRFFPDPRIIYPHDKSGESTDFRYLVKIKTRSGSPFFLRSGQFDTEIPLELDLVQSSEDGLTGKLSVVSFPVHFFRRDALVKKASVIFPKQGLAELDSQIEVHYADYDLTLSAYGAIDSPRYSITSQPPLSESSALSLLLFGRPLEQLSPGQGESLASARAALTSGAVSALSMYLLASTPIESVAYDPAQGRFSATVRLVEGTSLRVEGVKEGVSSIGIRKRLGRDWVLRTDVERTNPLEDRRSVSTFLEWSKTY